MVEDYLIEMLTPTSCLIKAHSLEEASNLAKVLVLKNQVLTGVCRANPKALPPPEIVEFVL
jgi:hypothetical protein